MDCSMPGFPVLHYLSESAQIHVKLTSIDGVAIQPPHALLPDPPPPTPALNLPEHHGLFQ